MGCTFVTKKHPLNQNYNCLMANYCAKVLNFFQSYKYIIDYLIIQGRLCTSDCLLWLYIHLDSSYSLFCIEHLH